MVRLGVVAAVLVLTLPFGFYRAYTRKLSARWFLAIHVPVPFIFLVRIAAGLPYTFIPFTCLAFASGQVLGGWAGRRWRSRAQRLAAAGEAGPPLAPERVRSVS